MLQLPKLQEQVLTLTVGASAGVCPVTAECEGEGLRDSVPVHDQKQEEPVCPDCHECSGSASGTHLHVRDITR